MGSEMGAMLQTQQSQYQPTAAPSAQVGIRKFYRYWALAEVMGYAQVYTEIGIPRIWGNFQISKEYADNHQELMAGMVYWAKKNVIEIDASVFFVKL